MEGKRKKAIPEFRTEEEEREFWSTAEAGSAPADTADHFAAASGVDD
jgi:hypothetical protein